MAEYISLEKRLHRVSEQVLLDADVKPSVIMELKLKLSDALTQDARQNRLIDLEESGEGGVPR